MSDGAASVAFHTGVPDVVDYTLRLVRKGHGLGSRVLVVGPEAAVSALDERLWTFEPGSFISHVRCAHAQGEAAPALLERSSVWLLTEGEDITASPPGLVPRVLVSLGGARAHPPSNFEKIIEVVGTDAEERRLGQQRWREYREYGLQPIHHAVS